MREAATKFALLPRDAKAAAYPADLGLDADLGPADDLMVAALAVARQIEGLEALREALSGELGFALARATRIFIALKGRLIVTGMGKSGHVARKLASTFASTGTPTFFVHPSEASHGDLGMLRPDDGVLVISRSGETVELSDIVAYTRRAKIPLVAVTSARESALGRAADVALVLPEVVEACPNGLAPTTSTTAQLVLGDTLAICLLSRRGFSSRDFTSLHPGGNLGARLKTVEDLMHRGADVPTTHHASTLAAAIIEMTSKRLGVTGVVDDEGRLVGVVTDGDLRRALEAGFYDRPTSEAMRREPLSIAGDATAHEALAKMTRNRVTCLFVLDRGRPVGIVSVHDLLRIGV